MQRGPQLPVAHDEPREVLLHDLLQGVVAVHLVDRLADVVVELRVVHRHALRLEVLDHVAEQARLGQREQRVDPGEAGQRQVDLLVAVQPLALLPRDGPAAVEAPAHVVVAVHLEDVAGDLVEDETADDELRVVGELGERLGVVELRDQPLQRHPEREVLQPAQVVHRQRVVHVEPDHVDLVHPQVAVDEDLAGARDLAVYDGAGLLQQRLHGGVGVERAGGLFEVSDAGVAVGARWHPHLTYPSRPASTIRGSGL